MTYTEKEMTPKLLLHQNELSTSTKFVKGIVSEIYDLRHFKGEPNFILLCTSSTTMTISWNVK